MEDAFVFLMTTATVASMVTGALLIIALCCVVLYCGSKWLLCHVRKELKALRAPAANSRDTAG